MKKIMIFTVAVLAMLGCGSSHSEKYSVTDDGNGTKSPRISKIVVATYIEGNLTDEWNIIYHYNKQDLLVQKQYKEYDANESYTYNGMRQIVSLIGNEGITHGRNETEFVYSKSVWSKTNRSVLTQTKHKYGIYDDNGQYFGKPTTYSINYNYKYNDKGEVVLLESSEQPYEIGDKKIVQYIYDKIGKVIQENVDGVKIKKYIYNKYGKLKSEYTYNYSRVGRDGRIDYFYNNKQLLTSSKEYSVEDDGERFLGEMKTYSYENKPYYSNPSPSYLDQGQYSSSGIY